MLGWDGIVVTEVHAPLFYGVNDDPTHMTQVPNCNSDYDKSMTMNKN